MGNYYFCRQLGIMLTIETTGLLQQLKKRQYRTLCAGDTNQKRLFVLQMTDNDGQCGSPR